MTKFILHFNLRVLQLCLLVLCGFVAKGQYIDGPSDICIGATGTYTIMPSPTSGLTYTWSGGSNGNIVGSATSTPATISWFITGTATVTAVGRDVNGNVLENLSFTTTVYPTPSPIIEWDVRVGCQLTDSTKRDKETGETSAVAPGAPGGSIDDGPCVRVCENSIVKYWVNNPTGGPLSWDAPGGTVLSASGSSCTVQWGAAGYGSVTVTEGFPNDSCKGTTEICIEIIEGPKAAFHAIPETAGVNPDEIITACVDKDIFFVDDSDPDGGTPLVSWYWDFGDGTYSSAQNPVHAYSNPGTYTVMLTVTNECNCTNTVKRTVEVYPNSQPLSIECPSVVCEGAIANYNLADAPPEILDCIAAGLSYWEVVGGTMLSSPTGNTFVQVQWDNVGPDGFGYVIFYPGADCGVECPAPTVIKVPVILNNGTIEGDIVVCPKGKQYRYSLPQWPATLFNWSISTSTGAILMPSDQTNEIILVTNDVGSVTINATYQNTLIGCGGTATINVQVVPPVSIVGNEEACDGDNFNFSLSTPYYADWTLSGPGGYVYSGSGSSFSGTYPTPGSYVLTVDGNDFCSPDPYSIKVLAIPAVPDIIDGPDSTCAGIPVTFTAGTAVPGTQFEWSVTGGALTGSNTGNTVTVTFSGAGPHSVSVRRFTVESPNCSSGYLTHNVGLFSPFVALSGPDPVCPNSVTTYNAGYTEGDTYEWFVVPASAGSATPTATPYIADVLWNNTASTVSASVVVRMRRCNQYYTDTLPVTVNLVPVIAVVGDSVVCRGVPASLSLNVTPSSTTFSSVTWTYPGGTSSGITPSPAISFNNPIGSNTTNTITVTATDPNGCSATLQTTYDVVVKPSPVAFISPAANFAVCPPNPVSIPVSATLQAGYEPTANLTWYQVGLGTPLAGPCSPGPGCSDYTLTGYGSYYVVAEGVNGCTSNSDTVNVISYCPGPSCVLNPLPTVTVANASDYNNCGQIDVTGTYSGTPVDIGWVYTGWPNIHLVSQTGTSLTLTADIAGSYVVFYNVSYDNGAGDTCVVTEMLNVKVPLITGIDYAATCNGSGTGYDVTVSDFSNIAGNTSIVSYEYIIDGGYTLPMSPSSYTTSLLAGAHTLQIKVNYSYDFNSYSCFSDVINIALPALPNASFTASAGTNGPVCEDVPIIFSNGSSPLPLQYFWDFGDATSSTVTNPVKVYDGSVTGIVTVTLTATNELGCTSQFTDNVDVYPNPISATMVAAPGTEVCAGIPVSLSLTGSLGIVNDYYWMNDTTNFLQTTYQPISVTESGNYWVKLLGSYGCSLNTDGLNIEVFNIPEPVIVGEHNYCQGDVITLYAYSGPGITYQWYRDGSMLPGATGATWSESGLAPGGYDYQVEISYTDGTTTCTRMSAKFNVQVNTPPPPPTVYYNVVDCNQYLIELTAVGPGPGNYTWSNGMSGSTIYVTQGGPYKVWFDDGSGCLSSAEIDVQKDPEEYMWVFPTGCYNFCYSDLPKTLYGPSVPFAAWEWMHSGGMNLAGSGYVSPYSISTGGTYNLYLRNDWCDRTSGDMDVSVIECHDCDFEFWMRINPEYTDAGCNYYATGTINNPYGMTISVTLSSPYGIFVPSTISVPPGSSSYTVMFIPNTGYVGGFSGDVTLTAVIADPKTGETRYCTYTASIFYPKSCFDGKPVAGYEEVDPGLTGLVLAPNPASNRVKISYRFQRDAHQRMLDIYDMTGKLVRSIQASAVVGTRDVQLDGYAAGMYLVIMRQDGRIIQQAKLTVTR